MEDKTLSRRGFMRVCGGTAALVGGSVVAQSRPLAKFERVLLTDKHGDALNPASLEAGQEHVFFYPFRSTPCFLINLGRPARPAKVATASGQAYEWAGGIGPEQSIVSFCAICTHKLSHPSKQVSFIGYRNKKVGYLNDQDEIEQRQGIIQCCSEHSIYDPADGARVLSGPAPEPLAAISLELDEGELYATGVHGGQVYERYFESFGFRLGMEFGEKKYKQLVESATRVLPMDEFTGHRMEC